MEYINKSLVYLCLLKYYTTYYMILAHTKTFIQYFMSLGQFQK